MTQENAVTLLAGSPGNSGAVDGPADQARFKSPRGIALDHNGILYIADSGNQTVRRISPDGQVSALAGIPGKRGTLDGPGMKALFDRPKISPDGVVSTINAEPLIKSGCLGGSAMNNQPGSPATHIDTSQAEWQVSDYYPEPLRQVVRWKTLIGGNGADWIGGVPQKDVILGVLDLDPGGYYPTHAHPAPEIYFVLSGTAEWTVGEETFTAKPGMAIYHEPNAPHRMVNRGTEPLRTVWFWWAPDGRAEVLREEVRFLETSPR